MDTAHPAIVRALESDDAPCAHEGDSALYVRLAIGAMDVNELCLSFRDDINRIGLSMARAMLDIQTYYESYRITAEQRDRLMYLLKDGIDDEEEATVDNDVPVYKLRFPSPDYRPPAA